MAEDLAKLKEFLEEIGNLQQGAKDYMMTQEYQLERLSTQKFQNPYDVFLLNAEATDEEIRRQFRNISKLIHPDKCKDSKAYECFHIVEKAYKILQDGEKRQTYQRIMREAWDRTEYERKKENKRREKQGLAQLPNETFDDQYRDLCKKLFQEIEEKKEHYQRLEEASKKRYKDEIESRRIKEHYRQLTEDEWETSRSERVSSWRDFTKKNDKSNMIGTKKSTGLIRPPVVKAEERPIQNPAPLFRDNQEPIRKIWK